MHTNRLAGYDSAQMFTNLQRKHPQSGAEQREDSREESAAEQTATKGARQMTTAMKVMMGQVEAHHNKLARNRRLASRRSTLHRQRFEPWT
ncbi:hypothetical protein RvY_07239 [Ramazzottius varieornatus]|uniref:Uncharacterized protein n=1 Tax=Ramazzottius varieornatus TaxID=947166 RepID=A0A1D1V1E0_RAMVA|nr:hypothetical protein RvY_07239 [Ramazzottius varieornatus]